MKGIGVPHRVSNSNRATYQHWHRPPVRGKRILIASSSDDLRNWLCAQFSLTGVYSVVEACACDQALHRVESALLDAMLVDVDLPELGGHEFCRLMRRHCLPIPIILLSRRVRTDSEEILGFEAGANDFLAGTFTVGLLLARLRARFRDFQQTDAAIFEIGPYRFEPAKRLLIDSENQRRMHLTAKEVRVLNFLCRRPGNFATRETLLREAWIIDADINTHTVETHIYRLRQKIERQPEEPKILITKAGGYRLGVTTVTTGANQAYLL